MDIIIFLYNVALLLLYGVAMFYSFIVFRLKKYPFCLYLTILFLFYIFDNTVIYMTEFLHDFSVEYDASFMTVPAFKTVIVIVTSYCLLRANNLIFRKSLSTTDHAVIILLSLWDLFVPLLPDSALMVWLYYLPYQLFTLYLSTVGLLTIKKDKKITEEIPFLKHYKKILLCTLLFSFFIVIEDTIVIFNFDVYKTLTVRINNRSITEDILSIIYAVFFIYHLSKELQGYTPVQAPALEEPPYNTETTIPMEHGHFYQFIKTYNLTTREQDILKYLLDGKSTQEISDILYISLGTVKTHVHNIYQKTNVTKKGQLMELYKDLPEDK
ncbi:helix-turn-helix transcriptional regulator [Anaerocolumna xylanovorans]|uniref:Regulatory protein, luxR family n=1 Tax=Anaerocolumna xylanovorans DSM 12503 TaxID=1121345 RepID=A0A1M7XZA6_9FIRM|nr:LuxR C-terminal-related transcriptional regulator [Anaerocolumna xylanovorans]SHO44250.1 regulatory protein, luxR family [Anaerocolumna xylanovorans DSM 12503]